MMFKIKIKIDDTIHLFELESSKKIIDLKNAIKDRTKWTENVDLYYEDNIPIRGLGKYNIEKGVFLDMYDDFELDNFNFQSRRDFYLLAKSTNRRIKTKTQTPNKKGNNTGKYIAPGKRTKCKEFKLNEEDFPPLGC